LRGERKIKEEQYHRERTEEARRAVEKRDIPRYLTTVGFFFFAVLVYNGS